MLDEWDNVMVSDVDLDYLQGNEFSLLHSCGPFGVGLASLPVKDHVLPPRRLLGFELPALKLFLLDVKDTKVNRERVEVFDFLYIDPAHIMTLDCLLENHINTKQVKKPGDVVSQDSIPGKGNNLVILLHGPP